MEAPAPALVFIGFMGAGKSLAARSAAAQLNVATVDSDALLEERLGSSIEQYFASHGEGAFREQEEETVAELLDAPPAPVISLGGGAVGSERVREALARHTVVLLDVDADTAWQRARGGRPLARDRDRFTSPCTPSAPPLRRAGRRHPARRPPRRGTPRAAGDPRARAGAAADQAPVGRRLPRLRRRRAGRGSCGRLRAGASWSPTTPSASTTPGACRLRSSRSASTRGSNTRRFRAPSECCSRSPPRAWITTTTWWPLVAAWWATSPASARPSTSAACPSCRCRPRSCPWSTRPTAARPASTSPRARTTSGPTTSPPPCSPIRRRSPRCPRRSWAPAGRRSSRRG